MLSYDCIWDLFAHRFHNIELRQALVRGKKWFGYIRNVCGEMWVFSHLPPCGEHLCIKNQRANTTPLKVQLPENQNPAPFRYKLCHSNQSLPCTKWKMSCTYATTSSKRSWCKLLWPCCALQHDCKGGLGLTKSQEIFLENSSLHPFYFPYKKNYFCFIWGLSSNEHICILKCFFLTFLSDFWIFLLDKFAFQHDLLPKLLKNNF